jgi:hypothetical protein
MADHSPFTIEERLIMAVWEHERPQTGRNLKEVFQTFQQRFNKKPATKATAVAWESYLPQGVFKIPHVQEDQEHEPAEVKKSSNQFSVLPRGILALAVREYLNHIFPGRWIGRVSEAAPAPLPWPPRSPDTFCRTGSTKVKLKHAFAERSSTLSLPLQTCE